MTEEERLAWVQTAPIERTAEPPASMASLKQAMRESHYRHNCNNPRLKNPSFSYEAQIAYLRHTHTNYDELLKELGPYENYKRKVLRDRCNEVAGEILAEIKLPVKIRQVTSGNRS